METNNEERKIEISSETLNNLKSTWKWTMFLSILGFIFLGLLIVVGLAAGTFFSRFNTNEGNLGIPESLMIMMFIVIAAIYFFPVLFLFRFSRNIRDAVQSLSSEKFSKAIKNLRIYFTYIGIMVIIVLSIYLIALIVAGSSMSFLKGI